MIVVIDEISINEHCVPKIPSAIAIEMLKYMRDIRHAAMHSCNLSTYDEQFRLNMVSRPPMSLIV